MFYIKIVNISKSSYPNLAPEYNQKKLIFLIPFFTFQKTPVKLGETHRIWPVSILPDLILVIITFKTRTIKTYQLIHRFIKNIFTPSIDQVIEKNHNQQ